MSDIDYLMFVLDHAVLAPMSEALSAKPIIKFVNKMLII
jgi:hypothetical protein